MAVEKKLVLACDVQRIFPHETAAHPLVLGLTLQCCFSQGFEANESDAAWTKLWRWEPITHCVVWFFDATEPAGAPNHRLEVPVWNFGAPAKEKTKLVLDARVTSLLDRAKDLGFLWDPKNPSAPLPTEGHMFQLQSAATRFSERLGYGLNLCVVIRIKDDQIPYAGHVLPDSAHLVVLPSMKRNVDGTIVEYKLDVSEPDSSDVPLVAWEYTQGVPAMVGYANRPSLMTGDSANRFIQLKTGWVRRSIGSGSQPPLVPTEDWTTKLRDEVAAAWDLPRHLLEAVQQLVGMPRSDFGIYWNMILASLRDRAGLGLIDTTDGNGLLRFAIQTSAPLTGTPTPSTKDVVLRDARLRSLQGKMRVCERSGRPIDYASLQVWGALFCEALPEELAARLRPLFNVSPPRVPAVQRNVSLRWQKGPVADLINTPGAISEVKLRIYANRSDAVATTEPVIANIVIQKRQPTVDGGAEVIFDVYDQDVALTSGWYEGAVEALAGVHYSERLHLAGGVAEDLSLLKRAWSELQSALTLSRLIEPQWNSLAETDFRLAPNSTSRPWYTTVWTSVAPVAPYDVSSAEVGEIRPLDGRRWYLTLGNVRTAAGWTDGSWLACELSKEYDVKGKPVDGSRKLTLAVEHRTNSGQREIVLSLLYFDGTNEWILASKASPVDGLGYHVRVELSRTANDRLFAAAQHRGLDDAGQPAWKTIASAEVDPKDLDRLAARFLFGAIGDEFQCVPPTLMAAPRPIGEIPDLDKAWEPAVDQGLELWNQVKFQVRDTLPHLNLAHRLALSQTARLTPVWNKQLPESDPDYRHYLQTMFRTQILDFPKHRFDIPPGAQSTSLYRDFLPSVPQTAFIDELKKHLEALADSVNLLPPDVVGTFEEQANDRLATATPHHLRIQVDRPAMFTDTMMGRAETDLLAGLSGFGALMQQAKKMASAAVETYFHDQPWRMLNAIDVGVHQVVLPPPGPTIEPPLYDHYEPVSEYQRSLGPIPLQYQDQVRQITISYRNQYLAATSPLAEVGEAFRFSVTTDRNNAAVMPPFLARIPKLTGSAEDPMCLPTLKFGQLYRVLSYVMGNCGSLPKLLTGGTTKHPAELRTTPITSAELETEFYGQDKKDFLHEILYLRRVGVAAPRLERSTWRSNPISDPRQSEILPAIPADVRPLSQEWNIAALTKHSPRMRFGYDPDRRAGDVASTQNWVIVVPRIMVAGDSEDDDGAATSFTFEVGIRSAAGADPWCGAQIERAGSLLSATVKGTEVQTSLLHGTAGLLSSGPLDFRVAFINDQLYLAWRRSDRDEPWLAFRPDNESIGMSQPPGDGAWVELNIVHPFATTERALTFGAVEFATGTVAVEEKQPLRLRPDSAATRRLPSDTAPVLLPRPVDRNFHFHLRPPATDLETWDSWVQMDGYDADARKRIWARHRFWTAPPGSSNGTVRYDGTIDDPAVEALLIELVPLRTDALESVVRSFWRPEGNDTTTDPILGAPHKNPLNPVQRLPKEFVVDAVPLLDPIVGPRLKQDGAKYLIQVREQELWELRIHPLVCERFFNEASPPVPGGQRFHSQFCEGESVVDGSTYKIFGPWRLVIEVATREVVQRSRQNSELEFRDLLRPLSPDQREPELRAERARRRGVLLNSLQPSFRGTSASVTLTKPSPRTFRYAWQFRLLRQVWRWRGRPVPAFPLMALQESGLDAFPPDSFANLDAELENPSVPMHWDAIGFGDRSNIDLLDEASASTSDQALALLFQEELSTDLRSLYYRFTVHAYSRYAGLYTSDPPVVLASEAPPAATENDQRRNAWRRLVVPCRREERPPRPAVRFIVPLTQSEEDLAVGGVPGLLVILDDSWYAIGGLAETLHAEIVQGLDYWDSLSDPDERPIARPEFGPDPAESGYGWTREAMGQGNSHLPPRTALSLDVVGPMGHTFDSKADAPLFNASAFVLRPPVTLGVHTPGTDHRALDWYFAKVRFRRMLLPEAYSDYRFPELRTITADPTLTPLVLEKERSWIVDIGKILLVRTQFTTFSIRLQGGPDEGGRGEVAIRSSPAHLDLAWSPLNPMATAAEVRISSSPPGTHWTHSQLRLRYVLHRPEENSAENGPPPPCHLTIQYQLDGLWDGDPEDTVTPAIPLECSIPQRTWHTLDTQLWDGAGGWPTEAVLVADATARCTPPTWFAAHVSDFTPSFWVQFLPDSNLLLPMHGHETDSPFAPVGRYFLEWQVPTGEPTCKLVHEISGVRRNVTRDLAGMDRRPFPGSEVGYERRVIVTELLTDVRGQLGHERYLGVYEIDRTDPGDVFLKEVHSSPVLASDRLRPDAPRTTSAQNDRQMRLRIVEFQRVTVAGSDPPALRSDLWTELFPGQATLSDDDAQTRIVRVSPPLEAIEVPLSPAPG